MNVSHQLALSVLADERKLQLQHVVKALDFILQHEKTNAAITESKFSLVIKYLLALDNKSFTDPDSIFQSSEDGIAQSLRAYLCYGIINWFHDNDLAEDRLSECVDLVLVVLEKCIDDLLNKEAVQFWTSSNEIDKLETQLSSTIGNP